MKNDERFSRDWQFEDDELSESDLEFLNALENETINIDPNAAKHRNPDEPVKDDMPVVDVDVSVSATENMADDTSSEMPDMDSEPLSDDQQSDQQVDNDPKRDDEEDHEPEPDELPEIVPPEASHDEPQNTPEPEESSQEPAEEPSEPSEEDIEAYESVPEAGPRCTNHCEDNDPDDPNTSEETCPHCDERIRIERMQWGAVAVDRNNEPLLPGDKVMVVVPHPMMRHESLLTINVPNMAIEDPRYIESTAGDADTDSCWLAGRGISSFTGWHMVNIGNPVWKFEKGKRIGFVEKVGSPKYEDYYPEQMIEDFMKELDDHGKENKPEKIEEPVAEERVDELESSNESERADDPESPDESERAEVKESSESLERDELKEQREKREERGKDMTQAQHDRFDNLAERIDSKLKITFGGTMESHEVGEPIHKDKAAAQVIKIVSRGMEYWITIQANRHDKTDDKGEAA